MKSEIEKKIYQAQTIGNVEPIEYMVPYPNASALIEGQNIKYSEQLLYQEPKITNVEFFKLIQKTSNWLDNFNIKPKEKVVLPDLGSPQTEILLFAIWRLGASAILAKPNDIKNNKSFFKGLHTIKNDIDLFSKVSIFSEDFQPKHNALLDEEALTNYTREKSIRLSHYNLLVNTNGAKGLLKINSGIQFSCDLKPIDSSWAVLKVLLPIYCGAIYCDTQADISISETDNESTYLIRRDINNFGNLKNNHIGICLENTAVLCLGNESIHLTDVVKKETFLKINGHSVMMGYTNKSKNEQSFRQNGLYIDLKNKTNP